MFEVCTVSELISLLEHADDTYVSTGLRSFVDQINASGPSIQRQVLDRYVASQPQTPHLLSLMDRFCLRSENVVESGSFHVIALLAQILSHVFELHQHNNRRLDAIGLCRRILFASEESVDAIESQVKRHYRRSGNSMEDDLSLLMQRMVVHISIPTNSSETHPAIMALIHVVRLMGHALMASDQYCCVSFVAHLDLNTAKGLERLSQLAVKEQNAASAFVIVQMITALFNHCAYEERLVLSRNAVFFRRSIGCLLVLASTTKRSASVFPVEFPLLESRGTGLQAIRAFVNSIKTRIIFNEESSRNLALSFMKHGPLSELLRTFVQRHQEQNTVIDRSVWDASCALIRRFLLESCAHSGRGLSFSVAPITPDAGLVVQAISDQVSKDGSASFLLRNMILMDAIKDVGLSAAFVQRSTWNHLILPILSENADVSWELLGRLLADTKDPMDTLVSLSIAIDLISKGQLQMVDATGQLPLSKTILTRLVLSPNRLIRHRTLLLIHAVLVHFERCPIAVRNPTALLTNTLVDVQTIFNLLRNILEDQAIHPLACRIMALYFDLFAQVSMLSASIQQCKQSIKYEDLSSSPKQMLLILPFLDPIRLLKTDTICHSVAKTLMDHQGSESVNVLCKWLLDTMACLERSSAVSIATSALKSADLLVQVLIGMVKMHTNVMVFDQQNCTPPIVSVCPQLASIITTDLVVDVTKEAPISAAAFSPMQPQFTNAFFFNRNAVSFQTQFNAFEVHRHGNSLQFLQSIIAQLDRRHVLASYNQINADLLVDSFDEETVPLEKRQDYLIEALFNLNIAAWLRLLARVLADNSINISSADLCAIVDSGILGFAVIGLSNTSSDDSMRRLCHLILHAFGQRISNCRMEEEQHQILLLLDQFVSYNLTCLMDLERPFSRPLGRIHAFCLAEMLALLVRPEHPMHRSIVELLIDSRHSTRTLNEIVLRLLFRSVQEEQTLDHTSGPVYLWIREAQWLVSVVEGACRFVNSSSPSLEVVGLLKDELHAAHLMENVSILVLNLKHHQAAGPLKRQCQRFLQMMQVPWTDLVSQAY